MSFYIKVKEQRGQGLNNCMFMEWEPFAEFKFGFQISTQQSRYKKAESNLQADKKNCSQLELGIVWVIHLYLYIYSFNNTKS